MDFLYSIIHGFCFGVGIVLVFGITTFLIYKKFQQRETKINFIRAMLTRPFKLG